MKGTSNSGFSLVEMLVAVAVMGLIVIGARQMMLRAQEGSVRDNLRKNHAETAQELTRRLNYYFKRHTTRTLTAPHKLSLILPSGAVVIETICVKNDLDYQAPGALLNRCLKCSATQRPVVRIEAKGATQILPSQVQKPDRPAAASVCFKNGSDPDEVEIITEVLVVDPITRTDKKVSKSETLLIKDPSSFTSFE